MYGKAQELIHEALGEIRQAGLYKEERVLVSPQGASIRVKGSEVLNFCANNYLGLSSHPQIIAAARRGLEERGFGLSSVRFICGTQDYHKELEKKIAAFLGTDDAILYGSCFDANGGLFETLLSEEDAVISDELNHASIIDGIRLSKARRLRYKNRDMADLEARLQEAAKARLRLIATDGVFSMDGTMAPLSQICELADRYRALVMVDDSHATGFVGKTGRGTPELFGVQDRVDVVTSTLGKALGGASGGFTTGRREIVELLRQRSRPYLFSNTLAPAVVAAGLKVLDLLGSTSELRDRLEENTRYFRREMSERGFRIKEGAHPIVPIML
ncbi:MAG: glycine C-acetyltransferase, partial [Acidobacteriota bacterium]